MSISRREFLKVTGMGLVALPVLASLPFSPAPARAADTLPPANESEPMPKSLKYCENANKPSKNCAERKAKDRKDQFCKGCQLYTKVTGEGDKELGKCMLLPKNTVAANGWCMSWVKRP